MYISMDPQPKTRRESKKSAKDKKGNSVYSAKHVRAQEALLSKKVGV